LDSTWLAGVEPRGEPREIDAEPAQQPNAVRGLLVVRSLDGERLVLLAELQTDQIEEILQPPAVVFRGSHDQRDAARPGLDRGERRLEPFRHVTMPGETRQLRIDLGALAFTPIVDHAH